MLTLKITIYYFILEFAYNVETIFEYLNFVQFDLEIEKLFLVEQK